MSGSEDRLTTNLHHEHWPWVDVIPACLQIFDTAAQPDTVPPTTTTPWKFNMDTEND